jgi:hypothetical protein
MEFTQENLIVGINNVTRALEKLPSDAANTLDTNLQLKVVQNIDAGLQDLELKFTQLQVQSPSPFPSFIGFILLPSVHSGFHLYESNLWTL